MDGLLALPQPPDAVFCFNDLLALGALRDAADRGLRVPDDVAVVGFDDIEECRLQHTEPDHRGTGQGGHRRHWPWTCSPASSTGTGRAAPRESTAPHRLVDRARARPVAEPAGPPAGGVR